VNEENNKSSNANAKSKKDDQGSAVKQQSLSSLIRSVADLIRGPYKLHGYGGVNKITSVLFLLLLSGLAWGGDGLEWADSDNGKDINWHNATRYCASNGKGWRLPTEAELLANFKSGHETPCGFYTAKCKISSSSRLTGPSFWTNEEYLSSTAWTVDLISGSVTALNVEKRGHLRALCVRRS